MIRRRRDLVPEAFYPSCHGAKVSVRSGLLVDLFLTVVGEVVGSNGFDWRATVKVREEVACWRHLARVEDFYVLDSTYILIMKSTPGQLDTRLRVDGLGEVNSRTKRIEVLESLGTD